MTFRLDVIPKGALAIAALFLLACGSSGGGAGDAGSMSPSDGGIDATASDGESFTVSDASGSTPIDAPARDGGSSEAAAMDAQADAADPFVDPYGGAVGCPDGGYPTGRGACILDMSSAGPPRAAFPRLLRELRQHVGGLLGRPGTLAEREHQLRDASRSRGSGTRTVERERRHKASETPVPRLQSARRATEDSNL